MSIDIDAYLKRYEALKADKQSWEKQWQRVADYVSPVPRNFFNNDTKSRKNVVVLDTTATESVVQLAHALNGSLTNPATDWFRASINDAALARDWEVTQWLETVTKTYAIVAADGA